MYGAKLKALRKIEGWTQEEAARRIGVSKQTYSNYESEKRRPSLTIIRKLSEAYGVEIDTIFSDDKTEDPRVKFFEQMEQELGIDLRDPEVQKMLKRAAKLLLTDKD